MAPRLWVAALVLLACGSPGPAFVRRHVDDVQTAPCLAWMDRNLQWAVDPALSAKTPGDKGRAAVSAAFASWQAVAASCSDVQYTEITSGTPQLFVIWRERTCDAAAPANDPCFTDGSCADTYNCWPGDSATLAVTHIAYSRSTGALKSAEVQLDAASFVFTNVDAPPCPTDKPASDCVATDIQNTLTHELGHAIGLDHTTAKGSTMSPTAPIGETSKRTIDMGTAQGFCTIYPRGAPTPSCVQ